jgi:peptidoglycan/LPS O-acetylase OafA/YrhL
MFLAPWAGKIKIAGWPAWGNALLQLLLVTPLIVAFCSILFALFERPFMRRDWYKRVWLLGGAGAQPETV